MLTYAYRYRVHPSCFPAENPLWLVGAPVRLAASLRLLARERVSCKVHWSFRPRVFREPLVAGRSAGPFSGVAPLAGPREALWLCYYISPPGLGKEEIALPLIRS